MEFVAELAAARNPVTPHISMSRNGVNRLDPVKIAALIMFSFLKFLTAVGIATFGIWYVFQYNSINEVTGGVALVCVLGAFVLLK